MEKIVVVAAKRTPFGSFGGGLKDVSATQLCVNAGRAAFEHSGVKPGDIDHLVIGNVVQSGADAAYMPRHVGLHLGVPENIPAYGVNRLCGSGFQAWVNAAQMLLTGEAKCVLAGGVEQMSQIPYVLRNARFEGFRMGPAQVEDYMTSALTDAYSNTPMAITAENLGEKYGISRAACDEYSLKTQQRCKAALDKGLFNEEMVSVTVQNKKGSVEVSKDEHPKPEVTLEKLAAMKSLFKKDGLVTAATASGIVDGAAMSVLTTESEAKKHGWKPLARLVSWASVGCPPGLMGIGPAGAIRKALDQAGMKLSQMDLVEVNEAFASQYLAVEKELGLDPSRTNVNGGAIAIGHPLGASGTRIMNHLCYEMARRGSKTAVGSACIGGGQGIAIVIERV